MADIPKRIVYVGGLEEKVTQEVLHAAFIPFGDIRSIQLPIDTKTGLHRGFAFVEFEEEEDADSSIDNVHNSELYGRVVTVNLARQPKRGDIRRDKPVWADDFYFRRRLAEEGLEVNVDALQDDTTLPAGEMGQV
eukprot:GHVR01185831.1.p1 GENE.GHVR01185831.1~~GHVR01185831.1.p1  ORF type:complete len:135 (-),score=34.76 GHVR01185831.1:350-754(-)